MSIDYHSPSVHNPASNDRTGHIWGELVQYGFVDEGFGPTKGAPWRAGVNKSTSITFSNDVRVEGKDLKAGAYALFLDVEKTVGTDVGAVVLAKAMIQRLVLNYCRPLRHPEL